MFPPKTKRNFQCTEKFLNTRYALNYLGIKNYAEKSLNDKSNVSSNLKK